MQNQPQITDTQKLLQYYPQFTTLDNMASAP
jgi:hypothetical protein